MWSPKSILKDPRRDHRRDVRPTDRTDRAFRPSTVPALDRCRSKAPHRVWLEVSGYCSGEALGGRRAPGARAHAIEAKQAEFRPQPQVSVWGLGDGIDGAVEKALANLPRRVCVVTDVECGIQRKSTRRRRQQHPGERDARTKEAAPPGRPHNSNPTPQKANRAETCAARGDCRCRPCPYSGLNVWLPPCSIRYNAPCFATWRI